MKNPLASLPNEKATKQLRQFAISSFLLSIMSLLIFWWLAIACLALGTRALLLSYHKANQQNPSTSKLRAVSMTAVVISSISIWLSLR